MIELNKKEMALVIDRLAKDYLLSVDQIIKLAAKKLVNEKVVNILNEFTIE